ncbi:PHF7 protein, partial [Zapornia atra]|nr:PHF7 protein [Zapornia atra]
GIHCFSCPHCGNVFRFFLEMLSMGIRIPRRGPLLDRRHTFPAVSQRHRRCDARECLCPGGREQAENQGPWQLLLCASCAAEGTHRLCSSLESTASWECSSCAGPATGKRQS